MGRVGDAEVHQAFVEFRQKESDKVSSFPQSANDTRTYLKFFKV